MQGAVGGEGGKKGAGVSGRRYHGSPGVASPDFLMFSFPYSTIL